MKYTKGKWFSHTYGNYGLSGLRKSWGFKISAIDDKKEIAKIDCDNKDDNFGEEQANAQLIATAPELLEALEKAEQDINWMLNNQKFLNPEVFDYIEETLKKAQL